MPKSRVRKKKVYTPPTDVMPAAAALKKVKVGARWVPILGVVLIVLGIAWLVTYYLTQGTWPIEEIGAWNLAVGFGMLVSSLGVFTQWH